jgi:uncharacterized SAM-binding protein YcdF (DUF218 family)
MKRRLARGLRITLPAILAVGTVWLGGLVWFGASMPRQDSDPSQRTDAIVVLTGGADRLTEGSRLLASGDAGWLFVSGVHTAVKKSELLLVAGIKEPRLAGLVILGYRARNTRQNAEETAQWLKTRGFTSIRLVTANYHMRRAVLEFRRAMPQLRIIIHPVLPKPVNPGPWWQNTTALAIVAGEYNKYLAALVGSGGKPLP